MQKKSKARVAGVFGILTILVIASFLLNLSIGTVKVDLTDIFRIIFTGAGDEKSRNIIMDIRLPRALMTVILGGGLAVSGFLLQTFFANPIAGPYILGISSGAKMAVALFLIFVVGSTGRSSSFLLVLTAFAGALIATGFIILISSHVKNMASLLAAGIMIGYICSAVTDFLIAFADDSDIVNLHSWSQGSFGVSMFFVMMLSKSLDAFRLGENYARSVGINIRICRVMIIILSSLLSACVTAYAGPVSFIGIAVPFLMREALKSSKPVILIPASFLSGSVFCLISDFLARRIFAPTELNISAVTSLFDAPIVILMIVRRYRSHEN